MKFERCLDSEVVKFEVLSYVYSKIVFLQANHFVEFHAQYGSYYTTRIPKFGRDLKYHYETSNLYVVGTGSEVYRLNLEEGRFLTSFQTEASTINACDINPSHQLFVCVRRREENVDVLHSEFGTGSPMVQHPRQSDGRVGRG